MPDDQPFTDLQHPTVNKASSSRPEPIVSLRGNPDVRFIAAINRRFKQKDYDGVISRSRQFLEKHPRSGLAHEIIGTAEFLQGNEAQALEALSTATELESDQSGPWTKLGVIQMEAGEIETAKVSLEKAVAINPNDHFAHQRLGLLYEFKNEPARAISHLEKGLKGTPIDYLGVSVNLARLYGATGQHNRAVEVLEPRLPMEASAPRAHLILATAYLELEQFEKAYQRFEQAESLDPELREARLGMAISQRLTGNPDRSLALLEPLVSRHPEWDKALAEKAKALLALDRVEQAESTFNDYIKAGGDRRYALKRRARYHLDNDQPDKARALYRDLVERELADANVYAELSELFMAEKAYKEGEAALRQGLEQMPESVYLRLRLGSYLAALTRYDEAIPELERAHKLAPENPTVLRTLSLAQSRIGDTGAAATSAGELHERVANNDTAIFYASRLQADGQDQKAIELYRRVLEDVSDNALVLNNLATLLADAGDLQEAERLARKANSLVSDNPQLMDTLGSILRQRGRHEEATRLLERAASLAP
ncbi:tetratricopeptide repeat protein [Marinimicrobium sp. C2-29]|uniref:tetratricopeptide repeat protein n=1 Tax=Marinimicrobium sp. C2-29 TaxID=3139825 RepID=UPI00313934A7